MLSAYSNPIPALSKPSGSRFTTGIIIFFTPHPRQLHLPSTTHKYTTTTATRFPLRVLDETTVRPSLLPYTVTHSPTSLPITPTNPPTDKMCRKITLHFTCLHIRQHLCPSTPSCNIREAHSSAAATPKHEMIHRFVWINTECWNCASVKANRNMLMMPDLEVDLGPEGVIVGPDVVNVVMG
ncbi:hypothetical protein L873DRAFT_739993 [Choiromyces venosus 120613-1]|uniref:Uncharacterized protein n=1 Tax=Choiromyces venosus 120613-1 TaxID=1336337 RepID=A0A3N4JQZ9_9PEZI|nr:hypothetical protein L873DRAFT_739993 [Choiromyces venosus 120613-1]